MRGTRRMPASIVQILMIWIDPNGLTKTLQNGLKEGIITKWFDMTWHNSGFMNHLKLHAESMWKGKFFFFLPLPYQGFPWRFGWWTWSLVERQNITNTCTHAETETDSPSLRMRAGQCTFQWCDIPVLGLQWFFSDEAALKKNTFGFATVTPNWSSINWKQLWQIQIRHLGLQICSLVWKYRVKRRCEWRNWHESISVPWRKSNMNFQGPSWLEGGRWWFKIHGDFSSHLELARFIFVPQVFLFLVMQLLCLTPHVSIRVASTSLQGFSWSCVFYCLFS